MRFLRLFLCLLYFIFVTQTYAITSKNKFWSPVTLNGNYDEFLYFLEPQLRLIERPNIFNQFIGSIAGGYEALPGLQFWFGQTITTVSQDASVESKEEYRSFEQIMWNHQLQQPEYNININSRTRFEQRKSLDFPEWAFRIRERFIFNIPLTKTIAFEISDELMYNINHVQWIDTRGWDQNRAYVAIAQTFSKRYAFAVGYMNQYLFTTPAQADNILYLNFRFNLFE